jgi:glutathione S-transferase
MSFKFVSANKNYSSWSMRPWVLLTEFGIPFDEVMLKFHSAEWDKELPLWSPSKLVPVLWNGAPPQGQSSWESTAIFEAIAEAFPQHAIWPRDAYARNHARCAVAEMHAGFRALRAAMPMNIRATMPGLGMTPDVAKNIARIETIWREARANFGGKTSSPFLYGEFSAADAMFAPVVMRFQTYRPSLAADTLAYCEAVKAATSVTKWIKEALLETEFVAEDEPYAPIQTPALGDVPNTSKP